LWLVVATLPALNAQEAAPEPLPEPKLSEVDVFRSYLQLQEQLHQTQVALERNRKEAEFFAGENARALATRLEGLEKTLDARQSRELEAMQSLSRLVLVVAGLFAALGLAAMVLTAYLHWRTVARLAEMMSPVAGGALRALPGSTFEPSGSESPATAEQAGNRLLGVVGALEKRLHELEAATHPKLTGGNGAADATSPAPESASHADRTSVLLAKGESLLGMDQPEAALQCFEDILAAAPEQPEALVKKGAALEQLRRFEDALACYDHAIRADGSLTLAYLQKGGLYNRLERYEEALQCYEQALRTQEKAPTH